MDDARRQHPLLLRQARVSLRTAYSSIQYFRIYGTLFYYYYYPVEAMVGQYEPRVGRWVWMSLFDNILQYVFYFS